jgi:spoIIIJ-associated protein
MTPPRRFFSAPSLTQALLTAARHYEVEPEALAYEMVDKKHGFLKKPRGVVIEIDPDRPTRAAAPAARSTAAASPPTTEPAVDVAAPLPADEAEPTSEAAAEPAPDAAEEPLPEPVEEPLRGQPTLAAEEPEPALAPPPEAAERSAALASGESVDEELNLAVAQAVDELAHLAGLRVQVARVVSLEDDGLAIDLEGPDGERVTAHGGRALLAMQHLLPRLLFAELGRAVHCRLDCDGFHAARGERLARVARKAAERVRRGGRSWLLEPMAPDERRLVHMALAEEPDVETESVGEGFLKRVRVAQTRSEGAGTDHNR